MGSFNGDGSIKHSEPKRGSGKLRYEVIGVPPAKKLQGYLLSERVHGQEGHWTKVTTLPHDEVDCKYCAQGLGWKWQGFFFAYNRTQQFTFVVRIPEGGYTPFKEYFLNHGSLRGLKFTLWRPKGYGTAPVAAHIIKPDEDKWMLPACPDMDEFLHRLFGGGYRRNAQDALKVDPAGEQLQNFDNLPQGVVPVNRLVDQIVRNKKSNGTLH